jgi:flagellar basal body-associated protein FliL
VRGSATRAVVPALVVLALVAVVAIAATGSTSTGTDRTRTPAAALLDTFFSLGLLAVVAGGVLVAYGLMQRKEIRREMASGRYRRTSLVGWILFVFVFTLVVYWRGWDFRPTQPPVTEVVPTESRPPPGGTPQDQATGAYEPQLAWIPIVVVLVLVAAAVAAYVVSERRSRRRVTERDALAEDVAAVLDETLDDLRAESDPRRAVIAAYARLEHVLAAHGLPRREAETQEEYLPRFLRELDVSQRAAVQLTELFERAKFSQHTVDAGMKEEAIDALEELRRELRVAYKPDDGAKVALGAVGGPT